MRQRPSAVFGPVGPVDSHRRDSGSGACPGIASRAQRRDEVGGMKWTEIDLDRRTWTLPRHRAKSDRGHEVHLSDMAIDVLRALPRIARGSNEMDFVFTVTGTTAVSGFGNAKRRLDFIMAEARRLSLGLSEQPKISDWRLHDLRRTAATGMAGLKIAPYVVDKVLNHSGGTIRGVAAIYMVIDAENDASIQAVNAADSFGSNKAGGTVLAFNTIGLQSSNFLFNAVDALLGSNTINSLFGASPQTNVTAAVHGSTLTAEDGSVSITASQSATIDAETTNSTTSLGPVLENASALAIGAILATNQTNTFAIAYADDSSTISASGDIAIRAVDNSQIDAVDNELAAAALQGQAATQPTLLGNYLDQLDQSYQYTSLSGVQTLTPGTIVYADPASDTTGRNGAYYVYLGELGPDGQKPQPVDLGTTDYTVQTATQDNVAQWMPLTESNLLSELPDFAAVKTEGETQGTGSSSAAVGAIFVLNTINASVDAHAGSSTLDSGVGAGSNDFGGSVLIEAANLSTINATNTSTVTASNGQTGPFVSSPGSGLAVNAIIATNNILGSTQAYARSDTIAALGTGGSIDVVAASDAAIDAENDASTDAKTTSVGVVLAFNTIGIKQPIAGFLENTVDALFGLGLAGQQPDLVYAYNAEATVSTVSIVSAVRGNGPPGDQAISAAVTHEHQSCRRY
jgi:Phage integrase family